MGGRVVKSQFDWAAVVLVQRMIEGTALFSAISSGLRMLTYKKMQTCFRLVGLPKSTALDDVERPLPTLLHDKVFYGGRHVTFNEDKLNERNILNLIYLLIELQSTIRLFSS